MSWEVIEDFKKSHPSCEHTDDQKFKKWIADKNITRYCHNRNENVPKFLMTGRTTVGYPNSKANEPPFMDHIAFYKNTKTNQVWLTSQPYHSKSEVENEVRAWAEAYNVDCEIYDADNSWYFPHNTCLIVYTINSEQGE